jgi:hypothetical protein
MSEHQASRTLVKSPPELWAECSDARSLARHLGDAVGEIRIKRLEPETTVAWEGEQFSGTVRLEPSGWGTKVTLTAASDEPAVPEEPEPEPGPEPVVAPEPPAPEPPARTGFMARFRRWLSPPPPEPAPAPEPVAPPLAEPEPEPEPEQTGVHADLIAALDSLGKAHHRPFSRA